MRHVLIIFRWEMKKIISNWRRMVAVFLLPAAMLLLALNVFPILVNYISTGDWSSKPQIIAVDAPDSFREYCEGSSRDSLFKFVWMDSDSFYADNLNVTEVIQERMKNGSLFLFFTDEAPGEVTNDFDGLIDKYFSESANNIAVAGREEHFSEASIIVLYNSDVSTSSGRAQQFLKTIKDDYNKFIYDNYAEQYTSIGGGSRWEHNGLNPFNFVLRNRANANFGASRVIPSIMVLLLYYCIYSLSGELLASERERGFLTKLYLTPISTTSLIFGKMLAIMTISSFTAILTYVLMFLSSWMNRTNSPESLLPFGLFLTPTEFIFCVLVIITLSFFICTMCFNIVLSLHKMKDIMVNLQIPLMLCVFEFFLFLFRPSQGVRSEYLIPIHNGIVVLRDIFLGRMVIAKLICVLFVNLVLGTMLLLICLHKKEGMIHILGGDSNDRSKKRK